MARLDGEHCQDEGGAVQSGGIRAKGRRVKKEQREQPEQYRTGGAFRVVVCPWRGRVRPSWAQQAGRRRCAANVRVETSSICQGKRQSGQRRQMDMLRKALLQLKCAAREAGS